MSCASTSDDTHLSERQVVMTRLLDAVKQCQIRFGGKTELATESDSRVCCLCATWEAVIQHGMKHSKRALSTLKQVSEITGLAKIGSSLSLIGDLKNMETEPVFWYATRELLNKHEMQRFHLLKCVDTDAGRGRAWLRSTLNEHSLEKFLHLLLDNSMLLSQYYEEWSLMRDQERSCMLPNMAAGLASILFAISIDNSELNTIKPATGLDLLLTSTPPQNYPQNFASRMDEEPRPVIAGDVSPIAARKKEKKKKKTFVNIVSFDEDDDSSVLSSSVTSPLSLTFPGDFSVPSSTASDISSRDDMESSITISKSLAEVKKDSSNVLQNQFSNLDLGHRAVTKTVKDINVHITQEERHSPNSIVIPDNSFTMNHGPTTQQTHSLCNSLSVISHLSSSSSSSSPPRTVDKAVRLRPTDNSNVETFCAPQKTSLKKKASKLSEKMSHTDSLDSMDSFNSSANTQSTIHLPNSFNYDILVPLGPEGQSPEGCMVYCEDTASYDSGDLPSFSEDTQNAAYALVRAQKGFLDCEYMRTEGDGSYAPEPSSPLQDTMTADELKQAVITMMMRKDEVELQNRTIQAALLAEADVTTMLRIELEEIRKTHIQQQERDCEKIRATNRENELLKHQLKKYVSAVQMLRRDGVGDQDLPGIHLEDVQPALPPAKNHIDYSHEAAEYEKKLIQVAEMHGELIEFNEILQKQLVARDICLQRLRVEMEQLRGPLPQNISDALETSSVVSDYDRTSEGSRPLVNIWIPSAFLKKSSADTFHVYQIYIRIHEEEWNIYRRYTEFNKMHSKLKKKFPLIRTFEFPPKKTLGNKSASFVEERRRRLQRYLRKIINMLLENGSDLMHNPSRKTLEALLPFFQEKKTEGKASDKKRTQPAFGTQSTNMVGADSGYTGL